MKSRWGSGQGVDGAERRAGAVARALLITLGLGVASVDTGTTDVEAGQGS